MYFGVIQRLKGNEEVVKDGNGVLHVACNMFAPQPLHGGQAVQVKDECIVGATCGEEEELEPV